MEAKHQVQLSLPRTWGGGAAATTGTREPGVTTGPPCWVCLGSLHAELTKSGLERHRIQGVTQRDTECSLTLSQGRSQNSLLLVPIIILSDNSRVHHSEISRIKPTQAEFPKLYPLLGNCKLVRGLHLPYDSISMRTRLSATSHLAEQKENCAFC